MHARTPTDRRASAACAILGACLAATACNNGGVTPVMSGAPTAPAAPGPPQVTSTSVIPSAGASLLYTVRFSMVAGTGCGQGLLAGEALTLSDGSVQDTGDANGSSGFSPFAVDQNCTGSTVSAAMIASRVPSLDNVLHVTAVTVYLSPPSAVLDGTPYPALASAVARSAFATDLYLVAKRTGATGAPSGLVGGIWGGTIQDDREGSGSVTLSLSQNGPQLLGTWSFAFGRASANVSGSVIGDGETGTLLLTPVGASCPLVLRFDAIVGSAPAAATYRPAPGCSLTASGSANISRK